MRVVAIVGGAVAGSEAAARCADQGILTLVIEQNVRPYGKIEDGLPRWHVSLRRQEYDRIDRNLSRPRVLFLPSTRLGRDLDLDSLFEQWGVQAVLLAHGAWKDRPLPVPDSASWVGKGLEYQNVLVQRFNQANDETESTPPDGAVVVGGGLASIDVVKILNLELYGRALRDRGHHVDLLELERVGIPSVLSRLGLTREALGVRGCTLFYRRRAQDMPLAESPDDLGPEAQQRAETIRARILDRAMRKYAFRFEERRVPVSAIVENGRLAGLRFRQTTVAGEKLSEIPGSEHDVRAPLVVSSIGSLPEPLDGIPRSGELYRWADAARGTLAGRPGIFGLGNVLTGRGNIKLSRESAREITSGVLEHWLAPGPSSSPGFDDRLRDAIATVRSRPPLSGSALTTLLLRVRERWSAVGYTGHYTEWIARHPPRDRV